METESKWMVTYWRKVSTTDRGTLLVVAILVVIVQVSSSLSVCFEILHNFKKKKLKNVVRPVLMFTLLFSLFVRTGVAWESQNTIMWLFQQNFSKVSKFFERAILVLGGQLSSLSWCELDQSGSANGRQLCPSAETQNDWGVFVQVNAKQLDVIPFI